MSEMSKGTEEKEKELEFEEALERLEKLATVMESGKLGLEKTVEAYEMGQKLIKQCTAKLNEVERRIEILVKGADGGVHAEPFADMPDGQE